MTRDACARGSKSSARAVWRADTQGGGGCLAGDAQAAFVLAVLLPVLIPSQGGHPWTEEQPEPA